MTSAAAVSTSPQDRRLDEAVALASSLGDRTAVVRLMETWAAASRPTRRARLFGARAFLELRLMERALASARELAEEAPEDDAALRLLAEVYLERGWPLRARKPLETLRSHGMTGLDELWARAHREPPRPETQARQVEAEGNPARLLELAEGFLSTGSFLRGAGILERLRRGDPEHKRVKELLWALAGEFVTPGVTADRLADGILPPPPDALPDEPEHTESASKAGPEAANDPTFPALFKLANAAPDAPADEGERTQSSSLASLAASAARAEATNPGPRAGEDTRIQLLLRSGDEAQAGGALHRRRDEPDGLRQNLNLREWQAEMGVVAHAASDLEEDAPSEEENIELLAPRTPVEETAQEAAAPIEVIEKHPVPAAPVPVSVTPLDPPPLVGRGILIAAALLALLLVASGGILVYSGARHLLGADPRTSLAGTLAEEDYVTLLALEGRLESGEGASAANRAALTEARMVLWSEFNGDPGRLERIRAAMDGPAGFPAHRQAMLRARLALIQGDATGAAAALGRESPADDEERWLFASVALANGDPARATGWMRALRDADKPRYTLGMAAVLAASGEVDRARAEVKAALARDPAHVEARLVELELSEGTAAERVAASKEFLRKWGAPRASPRQEGRAWLVQATAFAEEANAVGLAAALRAGLGRDGTNPGLVCLDAAQAAARGGLLDALHRLDPLLAGRPKDALARRARVLLLLDVDRVQDAAAAAGDEPSAALLRALVSTAGRELPLAAPLTPPASLTPLGLWIAAMDADLRHDATASAAYAAAAEALADSRDPFEARLAGRAAARSGAEPRAVLAKWGDDPATHLALALLAERGGSRAAAMLHFNRAVELGPEFARSWYERGRFFADARDGRAEESTQRYLALGPNGPRAARATQARP